MHKKLISFGLCLTILFSLTAFSGVKAQTRSRIAGTVKDSKTNEVLIGAYLILKGTVHGSTTDEKGKFIIINVPVGTYDLEVSLVGYARQTLKNVMVSADRVTSLDIKMYPSDIQVGEVVVTAQQNELHKEVSNTQMVISDEQLQQSSGIRQINAFLQKMPGISETNGFLTIRGGSADQTGTMVNGMSYNNAANGNAESSIPMSAIEQVSILSGGYNAEYGNFRSGLINISTKTGKKDKYTGTFSFSRNLAHLKRFGDSFYDPHNDILMPYLDPNVAFSGTATAWADDKRMRDQHTAFTGWIAQANAYNIGKPASMQSTPFNLFLLANWLHMTIPDYEGLRNLSADMKSKIGFYEIPDEQKNLFSNHHMVEEGVDWNFDGGFGGPFPFLSKELGDLTFYISNSSLEQYYVQPMVRKSQKVYNTMFTLKSSPFPNVTITYNGLWKRQMGISPARPPQGDAPNAGNSGGFMSIENVNQIANRTESYLKYAYDPNFFPQLNQTTLMNGITINHVLSKRTFYELSLSALSISNSSPVGDNRDSTVITQFGPFLVTEMPYGKLQYGSRSIRGVQYPIYVNMPGMPFSYMSKDGDLYDGTKINQYRAKLDITSQIDDNNYVKGGIEYNYIDINQNFWEKWNTNAYNTYEFNYQRQPSQTGIYIQDQITYDELVANIGIRADYYYGGGGKWPTGDPFNEGMFRPQKVDTSLFRYLAEGKSYIWDVWEAYDAAHPGFLQPINNFWAISPRIGVSFPITAESKFYFNYGHFRSNPPYYTMFQYRYRYDKNGMYDMANPNLEPPRTISYELGVTYNFLDSYILQISGYAKDVTGEAGRVVYQNNSGTVKYNNLANNQYQDIQGLEINLSKKDNSWISGWVNFNYMMKKNGLVGSNLVTDVPINTDLEGLYKGQETKSLPQPKINANITFKTPNDFGPKLFDNSIFGDWNFTVFASYSAGDYFTWNPLGKSFVTSNFNWPDYFMVDLKISKSFNIGYAKATFYIDISNVFNIKVNNLSSGYAFYDNVDMTQYLASLRLPMYDSPEYDAKRTENPGYYVGGNDKVGDLRSDDKPYINDPNYPLWIYKSPRDIWFGLRVDF